METVLQHHTDKKLPTLQVLRGVAACLVVFHHFAGVIGEHSYGSSRINAYGFGLLGRHGVDIFFVISGFIMTYTASRKRGLQDAAIFLYRRAIRIYPLYWIWMAVLMLMLKLLPTTTAPVTKIYLLKSALLYPVSNGKLFQPLLAQGWTLSFELLFYLVFALCVALAITRFRLVALAVGFAVLAALGTRLPIDSGLRYLLDSPLIMEFLFGVIASLLLSALRKRTQGHPSLVLAWILIALGSIGMIVMRDLSVSSVVTAGIPSFFLVLGAVMMGSRERSGLATYLGDASYSIYLTHGFFMLAMQFSYKHVAHLRNMPVDPMILLVTIIVIAVSSLSYPLVEKPLMQRLQRKPVHA